MAEGVITYEIRLEGAEEYQRRIQAIKDGTERLGRSTMALTQRMRLLGGFLIQASIMTFVWGLVLRRTEYATERVRTAEEAYNRALRRFGPASEQARRAARRLKLAKDDLVRATWESRLQMVLYTLTLLPMISRLYEAFRGISLLSLAKAKHIAVTKAATIVEWWHNLALKKKIILLSMLTAGVFALMAAMGAMAAQAALARAEMEARGAGPQFGGPTFIVTAEKDIDRALYAYARDVKREYRRVRRD